MKIICTEEHYMSKEVNDKFNEFTPPKTDLEKAQFKFVDNFVSKGAITDFENRIKFMDENGIAVQMVGYGNNSPMHLSENQDAVKLCQIANNTLYEATQKYKGRLYGYAVLPICNVQESVKELERCVNDLNFRGLIINGPFKEKFLDDEKYYPIFEKAAKLDIPVYLHPTDLKGEILDRYYKGAWNLMTANTFAGFAIGWHYDTAMHLMRFILSGILDKLPNLKFIVGHWGELLPFYFDRMDASLTPQMTGLKYNIKYYFYNNVYTNPSGIFSKDNFDFVLRTFNKDHILWAQDYPYGVNNKEVQTFLEKYDIDDETKEMIAHKNAEKLFKI